MEEENNIRKHFSRTDSSCRRKRKGYFELLTEYEEELLKHKSPDPRKYLEKCPESQKDKMILSLNLATLFLSKNNKAEKHDDGLSKSELKKAQRQCYENIIKNHC
ncbi:MAG: hypothetical protein JW804_01175 [Sedimentisphaerales bacterium]|nr:hypothetical protein [Sedimentisphaerales bacterium]